MTQDTRKDRRVKIVSLNVRYKSATVDEFIENHAHDVSRGGIYIKTGSPFPPGTLLKFEIRLSSDQAVITGVGRVVWKRDTVQGSGERPSGMGVKFIKIDDPSKTVIDKLVNSRADAGRAYESESETPGSEAPVPAAASVAPSPAPRGSNRIGKSTMLGIGQLPQTSARTPSARPGSPSVAPRPSSSSSGGGMFPKTNPEADAPPKQEQTVMKQAAELLEEALREAGGSMEDVGTNPLFAGSAIVDAVAEKTGLDVKPISTIPPEGPSSAAEAVRARAMVAGMSPAPVVKRADSDPPRTTRDTPAAKSERTPMRSAPPRASSRPSASSAPPPPKKGGSGTMIVIGVVVAAAAAGFLFREQIFGGNEPAAPTATASAGQAATAPPSASASAAVPEPSASVAPALSASAEPGPSAGASAAKPSDSAAPLVSAAPTVAPRPTPHPVAAPVTHPAATAAPPTATATPTTAAPTETTAPAGTAAPPVTATATPTSVTPSTTAAPAPKPKPAVKPADDNPY
jgi:uncharacterized protein (TIGR02266 family)